ncbi:hypothetical protein [Corynebacterium pyruviciproducens]
MSENQTNKTDSTNENVEDQASRETEGQTEEHLGDKGLKALKEERETRKKLEKQLKDALARIDKFEDSQRSEEERREYKVQKLQEKLTASDTKVAKAERDLLALQVATDFGIPTMASRLQGDTREELEADAEVLKKALEPSGPRKPAPVPQAGRAGEAKRSSGEIFKDFMESNFG